MILWKTRGTLFFSAQIVDLPHSIAVDLPSSIPVFLSCRSLVPCVTSIVAIS